MHHPQGIVEFHPRKILACIGFHRVGNGGAWASRGGFERGGYSCGVDQRRCLHQLSELILDVTRLGKTIVFSNEGSSADEQVEHGSLGASVSVAVVGGK